VTAFGIGRGGFGLAAFISGVFGPAGVFGSARGFGSAGGFESAGVIGELVCVAFAASDLAQPPQNLSFAPFTAPQAPQEPESEPPHSPQKLRQGSLDRRHFEHATRWIVRDMPDESAALDKQEARSHPSKSSAWRSLGALALGGKSLRSHRKVREA
jgi:hypothetical protein